MVTADMLPESVGTWLYHCHVDHHIHGGMIAMYDVQAASATDQKMGWKDFHTSVGAGRWNEVVPVDATITTLQAELAAAKTAIATQDATITTLTATIAAVQATVVSIDDACFSGHRDDRWLSVSPCGGNDDSESSAPVVSSQPVAATLAAFVWCLAATAAQHQ